MDEPRDAESPTFCCRRPAGRSCRTSGTAALPTGAPPLRVRLPLCGIGVSAFAALVFAGLTWIGIDEISYRKGHRFLLAVVEHDTGRLVWAAPGRDQDTLRRFFDALGPERSAALTHVSADGAEWIHDVVTERAPRALICLDPFTDLVVAWPNAEMAVMAVETAVQLDCGRDVESAADPEARRAELIEEFRGKSGAVRAAEGFGVDAVVRPSETRDWLASTMIDLPRRRLALTVSPRRHPVVPL